VRRRFAWTGLFTRPSYAGDAVKNKTTGTLCEMKIEISEKKRRVRTTQENYI
jgi:hypothetical protein